MSRRSTPPSLRRHKPSRQGVVTLGGRDHYLGHWPDGQPTPPDHVRAAYDARVAEWLASGRATAAAPKLTVAELILRFWDGHVVSHYRHPDGTPTSELADFRLSLRPLRRLFADLPAADFSPLKLKALRQALIDAGLSRGVVNQRVGRVRRVFRWAVSEELVPEPVYRALTAVEGLKAGRSAARERPPVRAVPDADVEDALPFLSPPLQALVRVQRLTGMRPGEAARMRLGDLDTAGEVWTYRPRRHKNAWRGKERVVLVGPKAQAVLRDVLPTDPDAFVFSPRAGREAWFAAKRAARKSKVPPSQACRRKSGPKRQPGAFYTRHAYAAAVARACAKAGVARWHPNQLRHARATEVRSAFGLEAAQVVLGHAKASVTEVYAARDLSLAGLVAAASG